MKVVADEHDCREEGAWFDHIILMAITRVYHVKYGFPSLNFLVMKTGVVRGTWPRDAYVML